jgi:hypothetical protein
VLRQVVPRQHLEVKPLEEMRQVHHIVLNADISNLAEGMTNIHFLIGEYS